MISVIDSGLVFRNPQPHLRSLHAWHPTLVQLHDGTLVAAFDLGQAVESLDYRTWLSRSKDGGQTWEPPRCLLPATTSGRSNDLIRLSHLCDGSLIGFGGRLYRDRVDEGFVNRATTGYVRMDLIVVRSNDGGNSWKVPAIIAAPLNGPSFEICHPIVELKDGRWLAPTSTWKGWDGEAPHGMQAIALVSHDRGKTWPVWITVVDQYSQGIVSWEIGLTQLHDERLLAVVWSFDEKNGRSIPNRYAISNDGCRFGPPRENGLRGETAKLLTLADGRVLCIYRRLDQPGLWANVVEIRGEEWINLDEAPIWQGAMSGMHGQKSAADKLSDLKFGFPQMIQLPDGEVMAVFWCLEDEVRNIRWTRIKIW